MCCPVGLLARDWPAGTSIDSAGQPLHRDAIGHRADADAEIAADALLVDDFKAELSGEWSIGTATPGFIGIGYIHDGNDKKSEKTARFTIPIEKAGKYEIRFAYTTQSNRATNVPVTIVAGEEKKTVKVNERKAPTIEGHFVALGKFKLEANSKAVVTVSNKETDGHVIVDAVQAVEVK